MSIDDNSVKTTVRMGRCSQITVWVLAGYAFVAPLIFIPVFVGNAFDFPKWVLTLLLLWVLLSLYAAVCFVRRQIFLPSHQWTLPLVAIGVALLVAMGMGAGNKVAFLMGKGSMYVALVLMVLIAASLIKDKWLPMLYATIGSSFVLAWLELASFFGVLPKLIADPLLANQTFSPIGSQVTLASFLVVVLPMTLTLALRSPKEALVQKVCLLVVASVQIFALFLAVSQILPGQAAQPQLLPLQSGWSIAVDQLKSPRTALFGVGPDNFASAFTRFRPANLNGSDLWQLRFASSTNEWLTIFTTIGILGLGALLWYLVVLVRHMILIPKQDPATVALITGFVITLILWTLMPANFASLYLLFWLSLCLIVVHPTPPIRIRKTPPAIVTGAVVSLVVVAGLFFLQIAIRAEHAFGQSLVYAAANRGTDTYNSQIRAIGLNPYVYRYRVSYSTTNLALANTLAAQENVSDETQQQIVQLVSQSIREARAAVALQPQNSASWANLANIYRQLINFAQGAPQWAVTTYIQAIRLDSTNPQLRLDFGGLLLALRQYEDAISQYKQAVALKPDFANAYYNLSYAYALVGNHTLAYAAMRNVVDLVDHDSADYTKATDELKDLRDKLPPEVTQAAGANRDPQSQLTRPEPVPSPKPGGEVKLNPQEQAELGPPTLEEVGVVDELESPVATASATPTTEPSPEATNSGELE